MKNLQNELTPLICSVRFGGKVEPDTAIERLLKQISTQMNDLSDEYKIVIIDAVRELCLKYKNKHQSIMQFLAQLLIQKGGYQFRRAIVDTFLTLIREIPESKDNGNVYTFNHSKY